MPVYIDDMCLPAEVENADHTVRGKWSHLFADTHEELMAAAKAIGLRPEWIQHAGEPGEHFDVVMSKRAKAVEYGAREVTWHEAGEFVMNRRQAAKRQEPELDEPNVTPGCSVSEPCGQEQCGACYPELADEIRARALDQQAGVEFLQGNFTRAMSLLREAKDMCPELADELTDHARRVRAAGREAAAKAARPRDLGEVADSFGERTVAYLAQRDANRGEPTEKCDAPKGDGNCRELGHLYAQGRRCDEHRPKVLTGDREPGK